MARDRLPYPGHYPVVAQLHRDSAKSAKYSRCIPRLVGTAVLAVSVVSCTLPRTRVALDGPTLRLTSAEPVAEFSVQFCVEGVKLKTAAFSGEVFGEVVTRFGSGQLLIDVLDAPDDDAHTQDFELGTRDDLHLHFARDSDVWPGGRARRCMGPQIIRFELDGEADETVELDWVIDFGGNYNARGRDEVEQQNLTIEIEPL